jgi:F-type H+-transporting ATPase subunit epsilon
MTLNVSIIAPNRVLWDAPANEVILSTTSGDLGVLPNHAPLLTALDVGVMRVRTNAWNSFAIMGGFATIAENSLTVIVNEAFLGSEISVSEAEADVTTAQADADRATDVSASVEAQLKLRKAQVRCEAAKQEAAKR